MDEIFTKLKNDYDLAMEYYGRNEFTLYFRNIRPALEWLCKLVIADQTDGKCKISDIFDGVKVIRRIGKTYTIQTGNRCAVKGRKLMDTMTSAFLLNRKDISEAIYDETLKGLGEEMEMFSNCIRRFYSIASSGNHSSERDEGERTVAIKYALILSDFITFLIDKQILKECNVSKLKTLRLTKVVDESEIASIRTEMQLISKQYLKQKEELDAAFKKVDEYKTKQEEAIRQSQNSILERDRRIKELEEEIEHMKDASSIQICAKPTTTSAIRSKSDLDLSDDKIDGDQEDIILAAENESLLVCGCAGSGKSVIAMKKAQQLHELGADVITIAYTKSLNNYMKSGVTTDIGTFYYHHQWKKLGAPSADYIIVDEIQDFTRDEILEFINAAKKHFFFFGDSAQSIFEPFKRGILSMKQISEMTGLEPMMLYTNYRLPRPVAKITQRYVGINVEPYSERTYKNNSSQLPYIVKLADKETQVIAVAEILGKNPDKSIGIFLPNNPNVLDFCAQLSSLDVHFEFKYEMQKATGNRLGYLPYNTLDFTNISPKVMTYHSAKGLQFDIVILPWFNGAISNDEKKALYVAMTRTQSQLIITYSDSLRPPLDKVPEILYKKTL